MPEWKKNLLDDDAAIGDLLESAHRIAVLGIRPESHSHKPAYAIPAYLHDAGFEVIPVPIHHPEVTEIFGQPVHRSLAEIPGTVDIVDIFRRPTDVPAHLEDILACGPRAVWFQPGTTNEETAETLAREGILVVRDRCIKTEHWRR